MTTKQMLKNKRLTGYYLYWYRDCMIDENKALVLANWRHELMNSNKYIGEMPLDVQSYCAKSWDALVLTTNSATEEVRRMANDYYNKFDKTKKEMDYEDISCR